jgi:hypothetical protein
MPSVIFTLNNTAQECSIITEQISGRGGADCPELLVPIKLDLHAVNSGFNSAPQPYEIISLKAELRSTNKNFKCSETINIAPCHVIANVSVNYTLDFMLSNQMISRFENYRKGNLPFQIHLIMQIALFSEITVNGSKGAFVKSVVTNYTRGDINLQFEIEQSYWIRKILPQLGYNERKLIEIPTAHDLIPDDYSVSLKEMDEAEKYFLLGDYDKAVGHCRSTIEPLAKKFVELKAYINSDSAAEWGKDILVSTENWLTTLIKKTSGYASKPHHTPSTGHFTRKDAEIIMMVTTATIAYVGNIGFKSKNL